MHSWINNESPIIVLRFFVHLGMLTFTLLLHDVNYSFLCDTSATTIIYNGMSGKCWQLSARHYHDRLRRTACDGELHEDEWRASGGGSTAKRRGVWGGEQVSQVKVIPARPVLRRLLD